MVRQGKLQSFGGRKAYQLNNIDHIHGDIGDSVLENDDLFFPEFGLEMEHIGYLNPSLSSYLVHELRSYTWLPIHPSKVNIREIFQSLRMSTGTTRSI